MLLEGILALWCIFATTASRLKLSTQAWSNSVGGSINLAPIPDGPGDRRTLSVHLSVSVCVCALERREM